MDADIFMRNKVVEAVVQLVQGLGGRCRAAMLHDVRYTIMFAMSPLPDMALIIYFFA